LKPAVVGSASSRISALEAMIARLEQEFGMTPMSRMRLGIKQFEAGAAAE